MADSLFDNRYRYDFIYPRGRSGETLRAVDTQQDNRPVVIKRPAPNDAPPIRGGQEVSILNERKALMRLEGHPALTELLGDGQFFVGGMLHQYIVMERADGEIVANTVLERARNGERMPELETFVIIDHLLDLLQNAHTQEIVHNDVDAKHLFWNRDRYSLKVIDWGNAVFLEGDEVTAQGVSRQSDVFQVGELLYFIVSGGGRADLPRDAEADFAVEFGVDTDRVPDPLKTIISKALHPNPNLRYANIEDLRSALTSYYAPFERDRDSILNRIEERLQRELSKNELSGLLEILEPVLESDPGYPAARQTRIELENRTRDLEVEADLDAVHIYMEGANWERAVVVLKELREWAGPQTLALVELLLECSILLLDSQLPTTSSTIQNAMGLIFDSQPNQAAHLLMTQDTPDDDARRLQWLLAERISSHFPEVILLRPNLFRLELALSSLEVEGVNISEARALFAEIYDILDQQSTSDVAELRDNYRAIVDRLSTLNELLSTVMVQQRLSNRRLPLSSLERAMNAAMALADNMHIIGKQATSSPRDAIGALDSSRAIEPISPAWNSITSMLNTLYELLQSYQTYVPAADGNDLNNWFITAEKDLSPFLKRLFDEMLVRMVEGVRIASEAWQSYAKTTLTGNRTDSVRALAKAAQAVGTISPTLSGWLNQLRSVVDGTHYIERHAIHGGLGRALADGWEAFDHGHIADAERLGQQAYEIARNDTERSAASRLLELAKSVRDWVERNGVSDEARTQALLRTIESSYLPEELERRNNFAIQMPSPETYLKAMGKGIIEIYNRSSSAALRLYFVDCILNGTLEAHESHLDDAIFWRDAALNVLGENSSRHLAVRTLNEFVNRQRDMLTGAALLNKMTGSHTLQDLEKIRRTLEENPQARTLSGGISSLRELELALRDWSDGEFRAAGLKLENAINNLGDLEKSGLDLTPYHNWLNELQTATAELHTLARSLRQTIERRPAEPDPFILQAHQRMVILTNRLLGEPRTAQMQLWLETYQQFLDTYTNPDIRRSARLEIFNEHFRAMFIDRHPAYPLYRHWYDLTNNAPEFPAPPTDDPTPRLSEDEPNLETTIPPTFKAETPYVEPMPARHQGRFHIPLGGIILILAILLIGVVTLVVLNSQPESSTPNIAVTLSDTPDPRWLTATTDGQTRAAIIQVDPTEEVTHTPNAKTTGPFVFASPTLLPIINEPSETPEDTAEPTATATETPTTTATHSPTPTNTLTPTLPVNGLQGWQNVLALPARMADVPWDVEIFSLLPEGGTWRLGTGEETPGDELQITFPPETLDLFYGNNAPARIRRTEATLSLASFNPTLLDSEDVFFGLMLQDVNDPTQRAGIYIQVVNLNVLNLFQRIGDQKPVFVRQLSVNNILTRIRIEHDPITGDITVFLGNALVGEPIPFVSPEASLQPVLFVKDGGVIVNVTNWRVGLR